MIHYRKRLDACFWFCDWWPGHKIAYSSFLSFVTDAVHGTDALETDFWTPHSIDRSEADRRMGPPMAWLRKTLALSLELQLPYYPYWCAAPVVTFIQNPNCRLLSFCLYLYYFVWRLSVWVFSSTISHHFRAGNLLSEYSKILFVMTTSESGSNMMSAKTSPDVAA